jgi:hypothetical protein
VRNAALMREAALKSTIFVGVPRVCRITHITHITFLLFSEFFFFFGGVSTYRQSELLRDSRTRSKTT